MGRDRARRSERKEWPVVAVVVGDGSIGRCGRIANTGVMYGSSQVRAGHENFWPIEWTAELFENMPEGRLSLPTYFLNRVRSCRMVLPVYLIDRCEKHDEDSAPPQCLVPMVPHGEAAPKHFVAEYIRRFLEDNPGVVVIIDQIGSRNLHPGLSRHWKQGEIGPWKSEPPMMCVQSALVNAVRALVGARGARSAEAVLRNTTEPLLSLRRLGTLVREMGIECGAVHLTDEEKATIRDGKRLGISIGFALCERGYGLCTCAIEAKLTMRFASIVIEG